GAVGPTVPLDEEQLRHVRVTGGGGGSAAAFQDGAQLKWPYALRDTPYDADREKFQELTQEALRQLDKGDLRPATVRAMKEALDGLERTLERNAAALDLDQIVDVRRYVGELRDAVRAIQSPNAANFFNKRWSARGRDVRELLEYMGREGLRFAPAV